MHILDLVVGILCGVVITLIGFWWEITLGVSISSQIPINPNDAFSTYFTFTNNSHFVLTNLRCEFIINGKDAHNNIISDFRSMIDIQGRLPQGHSDTERASIRVISPGMNAKMEVIIYYTPRFSFIPLPSRHDSFSFRSVTTPSGYSWIAKDIVK